MSLRFAKNHLWKSVEQFFKETRKLVRDQKEIIGATTIDFKELTWRSTTLPCDKAIEITYAENLHLLRLGTLRGKSGR